MSQRTPLLLHEKVKRSKRSHADWHEAGFDGPHATASRAEEGAREDIEGIGHNVNLLLRTQ